MIATYGEIRNPGEMYLSRSSRLPRNPFGVGREQNVECAGRAERRRRFGFYLGFLRLAYPKRSRATLASALQNEFFSRLLAKRDCRVDAVRKARSTQK